MKKQLLLVSVFSLLFCMGRLSAQAQSGAFFQAVTNLHPIGYWPLTETTSPPGSKPAANNSGTLGTADNGTYTDGAFPGVAGALAGDADKAALFSGAPGVNPRVALPFDTTYANQTNFSVEFWLNSAVTDPGTECLVNCVDAGSPRAGWLLYCDNPATPGAANFNFRTYATNGTSASVSYVIPAPGGHILSNTWYHVVVTFDGVQARGYINGQAAAVSGAGTIVPSTAGPFAIGARNDSSFAFGGYIDEVAFYSNVLSASDVLAHYSAGTNSAASPTYQQLVSAANPPLYFRLGEASAPVAANYGSSGTFANGFYESGTQPGSGGPSYSGFGSPSYACNFSGAQSADIGPSVVVVGASGLPVGIDTNHPVTFTLWAQASTPPSYFTTVAGKGDQSYRFDINDGNGVAHWNAGNENEIAAGPSVADGRWHFWAGTWDGSNMMNLYIDGLLIGQSTDNFNVNGNTQPFLIGTAPDDGGRNMQGSICHVALFPAALTTAQIQNLYFAAGAPPAITAQPLPTVAMQGSNVSITVSAFGKPPLSYQWYSGVPGSGTPVSGGNISGGTMTVLTFTSVQPANDGEYYVVITDGNASQTTSAGVTLSVLTSGLAGSYFPAVINLNPLGYWPLNETNQPPTPDVATNYGSLGSAGNAAYSASGITRQQPGALTDGDTSILTDGGSGIVSMPFSSVVSGLVPFSAEGWFVSGQDSATQCAISCVDANNPRSGWLLYMAGQNPGSYNFRMYNQNGTTPSLNISSPTSGITPGQYYHVVVVYDGSQGYIYINGQLANSGTPSGYIPNDAGNLTIGGRSDRTFLFQGIEDEVAIYTNALSPTTILAHYMAGTNPAPATPYNQLVSQSNPLLYYRLNEPAYTAPPLTSNPVATNYGASGSAENGYYLPGSAPGGVVGPSFAGLPSQAACHFNASFPSGIVEVQDASAGLNVIGPVTLTAWVKGDPGNIGGFQSFAGRGDQSYRGDVDQSGNVHFADGDSNPDAIGSFINDGAWHFFAGTWDGASAVIYVDGIPNSTQSATIGIPGDNLPFVIGGDGGYSVGTSPSRIFNGGVSEVAVFGTALNAQQIQALYNAAQVPPYIITEPANSIVTINTSASFSVNASGTPNLSYRWYKGTSPLSNSGNVSGATTATLTISPAQLSDNGNYQVVITNSYGAITSAVATLTVVSGPIINPDLPATNYAYNGTTATLTVGLGGTGPFTNGWTFNGQPLTDGGQVSGTTTPTLSIANAQASDAGIYQFWSTNSIGVSHSIAGQLIVQNFLGFLGNGAGWTLNTGSGSATSPFFVGDNQVQMTTANRGGQATSLFFDTPLYVGAFKAFFTYYDVNDGADGVCFVVQNSALGAHAVGSGGGGMGVRTITNSFEVELDLYNEAFAYDTNGLTHEAGDGFPAGNPEFQMLGTGDDVGVAGQTKDVTILYDGNTLTLTWSNETSHASAVTNFVIGDITGAVGGNTAFVGFTGACGGVDDTQIVGNFAYVPLAPTLTIVPDGSGGVFIRWPAVSTYTLQENANVANAVGWATISGPYTTVPAQPYDQYQVHVTPATGTQFYRLIVTQ